MVDFTEVLSKKAAEVEKPKAKPVGTYLGILQGAPAQIERKEHKILEFSIKLQSAYGDQPTQDDLAGFPPVTEWAPVRYSIFISSESGEYQLTNFLTNVLGIEKGDKTLGQMIAEAAGRMLVVKLKQEPYTDNNGEAAMTNRVESVAKA